MIMIKMQALAGAAAIAAIALVPQHHSHLRDNWPTRTETMTAQQIQDAYSAVISADVASTVALPDGRVLWLTGDATKINGQPAPYPHNGFVIQPAPGAASFTVLQNPSGQWQQVPNWSTYDVFWMAAGAVDNGVLHVFGARVSLGQSVWDITVTGYYDATFSLPDLTYQGIAQIPAGVSAVAKGTGGWWLIGTDRVSGTCYSDCYSAHAIWAPAGKLGDYASWTAPQTFLPTGFNLGGVVDLYRNADGIWTAWTKTDDIMGSTIQRLSSPHVDANSNWAVTATWPVPDQLSGGTTYGVRVHPGQAEPAGTLLVSVIENDSAAYGPQFLELPDGS